MNKASYFEEGKKKTRRIPLVKRLSLGDSVFMSVMSTQPSPFSVKGLGNWKGIGWWYVICDYHGHCGQLSLYSWSLQTTCSCFHTLTSAGIAYTTLPLIGHSYHKFC